MTTLPVLEDFDVFEEAGAQIFHAAVVFGIDEFDLQPSKCLPKTLPGKKPSFPKQACSEPE
jgi:hypothetical protein